VFEILKQERYCTAHGSTPGLDGHSFEEFEDGELDEYERGDNNGETGGSNSDIANRSRPLVREAVANDGPRLNPIVTCLADKWGATPTANREYGQCQRCSGRNCFY